MSSLQYLKVVVYFIILTELMGFSVEVLCCEVFKFLGKDLMDFGIRSGKSVGERSNFKKIPTHTQDHGDA